MADHRPDVYWSEPLNRWVFRASTLSYCSRRLAAAGLDYPPQPPPKMLTDAWAEGSAGEDKVLAMFRGGPENWHPKSPALDHVGKDNQIRWKGLDPTDMASYHGAGGEPFPFVKREYLDDDQFTLEMNVGMKAVVRGHLDDVSEVYQVSDTSPIQSGTRSVVEAKLLGVDYFKKLVRAGQAWPAAFPLYAFQTSLYQTGTNLGLYFVAGEKVRWEMDDPRRETTPLDQCYDIASVYVVYMPEPAVQLTSMKIKIIQLTNAIEASNLPECDAKDFPCPYPHLHSETPVEVKEIGVVKVEDDAVELEGEVAKEVKELVIRKRDLDAKMKGYTKQLNVIKERMDELLRDGVKDVAGRWKVAGYIVEWVVSDVAEEKAPRKGYKRNQLVIKDGE